MAQVKFDLIDAEAVQDPETLLHLIQDVIHTNGVLTRALAMTTALVLFQMGELHPPEDDTVSTTVELLKEFMDAVMAETVAQREADAYIDLLHRPE